MISIELIRNEPEVVKKALESRGEDSPIEDILNFDKNIRP